MSKEPHSEFAQVDTGLALANDEDFALPEEVKRELALYGVDDLWAAADRTAGLDRAVKIHTGFIFMALKERLKGNFKNAVTERYGQAAFCARFHRTPTSRDDTEVCGRLGETAYHGVWRCMSYARATLHLPEVARLLGFRCIKKALALPAAQLQEIQEKVTGIPADIAKAITAAAIDAEYNEMKKRKRERMGQRRAAANKPPAPLPERNTDAAWVVVRDRWIEALAALCHLVAAAQKVKMKREYFDEVFEHPNGHWCTQLGSQLDLLVGILSPYEEVKRRGLSEE